MCQTCQACLDWAGGAHLPSLAIYDTLVSTLQGTLCHTMCDCREKFWVQAIGQNGLSRQPNSQNTSSAASAPVLVSAANYVHSRKVTRGCILLKSSDALETILGCHLQVMPGQAGEKKRRMKQRNNLPRVCGEDHLRVGKASLLHLVRSFSIPFSCCLLLLISLSHFSWHLLLFGSFFLDISCSC